MPTEVYVCISDVVLEGSGETVPLASLKPGQRAHFDAKDYIRRTKAYLQYNGDPDNPNPKEGMEEELYGQARLVLSFECREAAPQGSTGPEVSAP